MAWRAAPDHLPVLFPVGFHRHTAMIPGHPARGPHLDAALVIWGRRGGSGRIVCDLGVPSPPKHVG